VSWGVVIPLGILIWKPDISFWDVLSQGMFMSPDSHCHSTDHGSFLSKKRIPKWTLTQPKYISVVAKIDQPVLKP
jgi:hypothetical protein